MTRMRILYGVLIVSLALNLILGGFMIGRAWDHWHRGGHAERWGGPDGPPRWMQKLFGEAGEPYLRAAWEQNAPSMGALRDRQADARNRAVDLLGATPFDVEAYRAALAEMRAATEATHAARHDVMADALAQVPAEVRAEIAEKTRRWAERRDQRRKDR